MIDQPQERGLAGSGRSEQRHNLTTPHFEIDALQNLDMAEALAYVQRLDHRHLGVGLRGVPTGRFAGVLIHGCHWPSDACCGAARKRDSARVRRNLVPSLRLKRRSRKCCPTLSTEVTRRYHSDAVSSSGIVLKFVE